MPFGLTILIVISILILFGVAHRVLDRMRLSDKAALFFVIGIFIGSLLPDIPITKLISINVGGAIIPIILCIYLILKAESSKEKRRSLWAPLVSAVVIYLSGRFLPSEPEIMLLDPNYIYGIIGGIVAYVLGRSQRAAFIAGILGVLLADIGQFTINQYMGIRTPLRLGADGSVDAVIISGILAVLFAEGIGEIREKMQGGTIKKNFRFDDGEFGGMNEIKAKRMKVHNKNNKDN